MAGEAPINLRTERKRRDRARAEEAAARNRVVFGRSAAQKGREDAERKLSAAFLDARRRDPEEPS